MNNVSKNRPLIFIIALLLLSNIIMLTFILFNSNNEGDDDRRGHGGGKFSDVLKKDIGFSDQQLSRYQKLREAHRAVIRPLFENLRETKNQFYFHLSDTSFTEANMDSAALRIGEGQALVDKKTFYYFRNIRNLCTADQLPAFDSAYPQIIRRMIGGQKQEKKDSSSPEKRK